MYIIPAIDLMKGECVRLIQGEYHRRITYRQDPVRQAEQFHADGAQWLHIVDLEGAKIGIGGAKIGVMAISGLIKAVLTSYEMDDFERDIEYETEKEIGLDSRLSLLVRSTAHRSPNGEIVTVYKSIIDITQRKIAVEKLKRTLETTRKILEALPIGIILLGNDKKIQ